MMRRGKDKNGSRVMRQKAVPCPVQTKEYCSTFHLINKGNGKEAKYDMVRASRSHNWAPKLVFRMFNMAMINAYVVYKEGDKGGGECVAYGESSKGIGARLMPTRRAPPGKGGSSSISSARYGSS